MEDFKSNPKMSCYKEGGSVKYKSRKSVKETDAADIAQDKAVVKKAFAIHDKQEHPGEKTDLSTLKKGGRAKKAVGTVRKYKTGGSVDNVYGAKKKSGDLDNIQKTKDIKATKLCMGGKAVKKMADGGLTGQGAISNVERAAMQNALPGGIGQGSANDMERRRMMDRAKNAMKYLGPQQQNEFIKQGGMNPVPATPTARAMKKGGKVKKCAEGGSLKEVDAQDNPGLAKLPTNVRNKMGYMRAGGKAKKMNTGGTCS